MKYKTAFVMGLVLLLSGCGKGEFQSGNSDLSSLGLVDADVDVVEESLELGHPGTANQPAAPYTIQALSTSSIYISRFELYNADTGVLLRTILDNAVLDLAKDGKNLTIRARVGGSGFESVSFQLDNQTQSFVDNTSPFSLAGNNSSGGYNAAQLTVGSHSLKATPFTRNYAGGSAGTSKTIAFSVINSAVVTTPPPVVPPATTLAPFRSDIVRLAQSEADLALCAAPATSRYVAATGSAWCSEFARWVFIKAGAMKDSTAALWDILSWNRFQTFFTDKKMFLSRSQITKANSEPNLMIGNYLLLDTDLDGVANHSAIIVGVSADLTKLYTVEGNISDCTRRLTRNFWVNGVVDSKIMGIGKVW